MTIKTAILTLKPVARKRRRRSDYSDIDPQDIDPDTGRPYEGYSSPCIEPHPFGGGISAGDY
jgi:hypothetical protein